ncbi:MerR family transcriptional regulator [Legionella feeleii]|uniref:HTH-type transcriptional repressor YcgE n=1 Tax=Legionella feeleii TaxID=453 RepID=A0A0W0TUM3_9GAMM|nr:MerR family transcriptional regulator [Legionella feeleii]KTC99212.1 HTH-type transcriptional repressor YcgE [Legionella feeleii]SPX61068.1 HTH-type transcriptional repressor YcgE [Legionella feeleii]
MKKQSENEEVLLPIRTISALTGVNSVTIRAWERRYGLLKPKRTAKGHRLYTYEHVQQIKKILALIEQGVSVGQIKETLLTESIFSHPLQIENPWRQYQLQMRQIISSFEQFKLDNLYNQILSLYPIDIVTKYLLLPVFFSLEQDAKEKRCLVAEYNFFQIFLRNKLGARLHHERQFVDGPRLLLVSSRADRDEVLMFLFSLTALAMGYVVICLYFNDDADELIEAAAIIKAQGLVLIGEKLVYEQSSWVDKQVDKLSIPVFGFIGPTEIKRNINKSKLIQLNSDFRLALEEVKNQIERDVVY